MITELHHDAEGIPAVRQWSSEAAPPVNSPQNQTTTPQFPDAEGIPAISRWSRSEATTPPDHRATKTRIPEGCQPPRRSVQIPIFIFHARRFQELHQFLAKRLHEMMLGLVRDVFLHLRPRRRANGECTVAFLPRKIAQLDLVMNPDRRSLFQLPHEIGKTMRRLQPHQQMHMIGHAADTLRKPAKSSHRAAEVFVEAFAPSSVDERNTILRGENDVVMQSEERRGHNGAVLLASLRDAGLSRIVSGGIASLNQMPAASGGVAPLNHRLIAENPLGSGTGRREPGGFKAISRWLSGATTPPVCHANRPASRRDASMCPWLGRYNGGCCLASLWDALIWPTLSGGIASLNHRLMALNPSGS
jgi:hypothetical protein